MSWATDLLDCVRVCRLRVGRLELSENMNQLIMNCTIQVHRSTNDANGLESDNKTFTGHS